MDDVINVQRGEYVFGAEDGQLRYTDEAVVHVPDGGADANRIPAADVVDVRRTVDRSVTGFRAIGVVIGLVALLFTGVTGQLVASGAGVGIVTVGTALCAAFGWLTAIQYYRAEHGELDVVAIETTDEQLVFYTQGDGEGVDRIVEALRAHERGPARTTRAPARE